MSEITRREFVAAAAAVALAGPALAKDLLPIRIGLVGCGGRGTGAALNCLESAKGVELVALGDMFADRLKKSRDYLAKSGHPVADERCHVGFDAYKKVTDDEVDLVLFATPPGFRPMHMEYAVDAGKHVFIEKPVAVDPVGVRRVIAAGEKAKANGTGVLAGTQYRHQESFLDCVGRVHGGAIGEIRAGRAYYNSGGVWHRGRKPAWSEMEWQLRNWYYFCWLSGDHIVEQHVHTIDACNWVMKGPPVSALAVGGRQVRTLPKYGNIFDHFCVDYEYPGGAHIMSMCRHWKGSASHVGAYFAGTKGEAAPYKGTITGPDAWKYEGGKNIGHAYVQEHSDLIASIRAGTPLNEARQVAESTMTAIMGREAAYTGRLVRWDEIMRSETDLMPPQLAFGDIDVRPVPRPGA